MWFPLRFSPKHTSSEEGPLSVLAVHKDSLDRRAPGSGFVKISDGLPSVDLPKVHGPLIFGPAHVTSEARCVGCVCCTYDELSSRTLLD